MATETTPINWFQKIGDLGTEGLSEGFKTGNFGLTDAERAYQMQQVSDENQRFNAENSARLEAEKAAQSQQTFTTPPSLAPNVGYPMSMPPQMGFPTASRVGMYQVPNRDFRWNTTPMEQVSMAGTMGRQDLSPMLATGEYGPLAGQNYQYQDGNTLINYGPGGGYGGGFGVGWPGYTPPGGGGPYIPPGGGSPYIPPGGRGVSCFIDGVQVELADGSEKNVSEISVGDIVKTEKGDGTVVKVYPSKAGKQRLYGFNGKKPFVTQAHPFMTQDGWKKISEVKEGDTLYRNGLGNQVVESIESKEIPEDTPVYNFHVDKHENYYADGYLVHNKSGYPGDPPPGDPPPGDPPPRDPAIFIKQLQEDNDRIKERNRLLNIYRDPTSDLNLNFAFEDTKANARRGIFPEKTYQDILNEKQAFMDAGRPTTATTSREQTLRNASILGSQAPTAVGRDRGEDARLLAAAQAQQAQDLTNRMRNVIPPSVRSAQEQQQVREFANMRGAIPPSRTQTPEVMRDVMATYQAQQARQQAQAQAQWQANRSIQQQAQQARVAQAQQQAAAMRASLGFGSPDVAGLTRGVTQIPTPANITKQQYVPPPSARDAGGGPSVGGQSQADRNSSNARQAAEADRKAAANLQAEREAAAPPITRTKVVKKAKAAAKKKDDDKKKKKRQEDAKKLLSTGARETSRLTGFQQPFSGGFSSPGFSSSTYKRG